ncbi:gamma-glutamyltransferase [Sulfitobacter sp. JB4-11]|uniref:gamma-glutamyltransferase n=1 Tax=Sulfitobacter rhodophyticola TaxID=3238304 RepID=UPI003516A66C
MTPQQNASWRITKPAITSRHGIVASQSRVAATIGAQIMAQGGNAVDAAIATSFALGAAEPWMSGMGGGGYMVVRPKDGPAQVLEFGMRAPAGLRVDDYPIVGGKANDLFPWPAVQDDRNVFGATAVAIPGQVAGMALAHETFATKPWGDLIAPAIKLADDGLPVDWFAQLIIGGSARDLHPFAASRETFLDDAGFPKSSGWTALGETRCDLSRLAASLRVIAEKGASGFYEGPLAESIIRDLQTAGGRHTLQDLATYRANLVDASEHDYRGHKIVGTPTLTAGPTLARALALMAEGWQADGAAPDATAYAAYDAAIRQANHERYDTMGDVENEPDPSCTSHFSVVDADGTMVAVTQTLLSIFGSRLMLPGSGILMNNGIMWFDPEQGKPNSLGPGKRCLANMCPTVLERSDGALFALGASGGRKIMPAVAQLTSMVLDYGMDLDTALHTPRIDMSLAEVTIADDSLPPKVLDGLRSALPHPVTPAPRTIFPLHFACPSAVSRQDGINAGATEVMTPWADAVAADDHG